VQIIFKYYLFSTSSIQRN